MTGSGTDPGKDDYFNISNFEELLKRLEASKGRDIFATGLAGMMSNFW